MAGRSRSIPPEILDVLCEHLLDHPEVHHHETVDFLQERFRSITTDPYLDKTFTQCPHSKSKHRPRPTNKIQQMKYPILPNLLRFQALLRSQLHQPIDQRISTKAENSHNPGTPPRIGILNKLSIIR